MSKIIGRRTLLKAALTGVASLPLAAALVRPARADDQFPLLKEEDTTAKSIGYVADAGKVDATVYPTFRKGQDCSNCKLYLGDKGEPQGACELVLGQFVLAKAWCKAWEARPGA
jgi:hypothetical protein